MGHKVYKIDIHGEEKIVAVKKVQKLLSSLSNDYKELVVVHGYRNGSILQNAIRNELKHYRIKRKIITFNHGETTFILNKNNKNKWIIKTIINDCLFILYKLIFKYNNLTIIIIYINYYLR